MWKTERKADSYTGTNTAQTLPELLDELELEELITPEEKAEIEKTGHVVIGSKDISFAEGLTESSYTITSSLDEVNFNKIITEGDIAIEKPGFTNYTIEGISTSKEGEYLTSGSVTGKSGNLEIIGSINDATFKYTLTNFMQGDEVFYCKVNIDGEEHYKEIKVVQGDVVTYEEDFAGIQYTGNWSDEENENFTNGKAKIMLGSGAEETNTTFVCDFYGTGIDYVTKAIPESPAVANSLQDIEGNYLARHIKMWDSEGEDSVYGVKLSDLSSSYINLTEGNYTFTGTIGTTATKFYLDTIIIYK